ncbi:MAG: efflux RND transporter periplasmic adaptor subunit [Filifactoraceae bacterium]
MAKFNFLEKIKRNKKKTIIAAVVSIALIGGFFLFGGKGDIKSVVNLDTVESRDIEQVISLKSTVEGETNYDVSSLMNLEVTKILVAEGDKVNKGQVLAELDRANVNDEIISATKRLELSKLNLEDSLKTAQRQYDDAVRNLNESKRKFEINNELFIAEAISQEELKQYELAVAKDQALVDSFEASNGIVVANSAQRKAIEVEQQSLSILKKKLEDTYIKSTANGTVTRVNIKVGSLATDTENRKPMFIIEDLENLKMTVKASEYDINKIKVGQDVKVYADILGEDYVTGKVSKILPTGEQKDPNSSERIIPVEVKIDNMDDRLITGITARADIIINSVKAVPSIMADSVVVDSLSKESKVYIVNKEGKVESLKVTIGTEDNLYSEITSANLKIGDKIISSPGAEIMDGMEVSIEGNVNPDEEKTDKKQP